MQKQAVQKHYFSSESGSISQKILMGFGIVFIAIVVIVTVVSIIMDHYGKIYQREGETYADKEIPAIFSTWDEDALIKQASPEFWKIGTPDELKKVLKKTARSLGKFIKYNGSRCSTNMTYFPTTGKVIKAECFAQVVYENAPAMITIIIIKHNKKWKIEHFSIDSKALLP